MNSAQYVIDTLKITGHISSYECYKNHLSFGDDWLIITSNNILVKYTKYSSRIEIMNQHEQCFVGYDLNYIKQEAFDKAMSQLING